jgi:hypothetical protein
MKTICHFLLILVASGDHKWMAPIPAQRWYLG